MAEKTITPYPTGRDGLIEGRSVGTKVSLVNYDHLQEVSPPSYCKDYLQEGFLYSRFGIGWTASVCGFYSEHIPTLPPLRRLAILFVPDKPETLSNIHQNVALLSEEASVAGMAAPILTVEEVVCGEQPGFLVSSADGSEWADHLLFPAILTEGVRKILEVKKGETVISLIRAALQHREEFLAWAEGLRGTNLTPTVAGHIHGFTGPVRLGDLLPYLPSTGDFGMKAMWLSLIDRLDKNRLAAAAALSPPPTSTEKETPIEW